MILQALNDLYPRLATDPTYEIPAPGFSPQKISFCVAIEADGSLVDIQDARTPDDKGRMQSTSMLVPGEAKPSGSGVNPCFLWDNQTYILGRQPEDKPAGFGLKRFQAFRDRHLALEAAINVPEFSAVCRFLESWSPEDIAKYPLLAELETGFGIFRLGGEKRPVHELPAIREWWLRNLGNGEGDAIRGFCLVTGEEGPIARLHPKIKGIPGAQAAGASLVSFNSSAYDSYGKDHEQGLNSPVNEEIAFRYGAVLNSLLTGPQSRKHRFRLGDTTVVFWTETPTVVEDCFAEIFSEGSQALNEVQDVAKRAQIERLLTAVRDGTGYREFDDGETKFYILGLAPNAARLSIRFFHRSPVTDLLKRLHEHHQCIQIAPSFTEQKGSRHPDPEFPALWQILRETARVADEIPPLLGGALARAVVEGTPYPEGLFDAIIRRIRADHSINYLRAATLKAILVRNQKLNIPTMLDTENTDPAYLLGRLFAAFEKTQDEALPGLNAGIREKFYSSASATPAAVFPRLLQTYTHHLAKLSKGAEIVRERLIQEILSGIGSGGFPKQLSLKDQGVFAIGYYHQRKDLFTKKDDQATASQSE